MPNQRINASMLPEGVTPEQAAIVAGAGALILIPTLYGTYKVLQLPGKAYEYLTTYLSQEGQEKIKEKDIQEITEYLDTLDQSLVSIQQDTDNNYTRSDIIEVKQQAEIAREKIAKDATLPVQTRRNLIVRVNQIINDLTAEQDRMSYSFDPRYLGRQLKRTPGALWRYGSQYMPSWNWSSSN